MIEVVAVTGLALVQDRGRPGHMHQGVPPGGALVPEMLARANASVRNGPGEAGLEVYGSITLLARGAALVGSEDGSVTPLRAGDTWALSCGRRRVRYACVRGGLAVPEVLGGRGTLLVAGIGGHQGRPLEKGDALPIGDAGELTGELPMLPHADAPIRVVPGPDLDRFHERALGVLLASEYRVSARSDRVGLRLTGPPLPRSGDDSGLSAPMVRGAIQVPGAGEPIVLGPDHPTMGGYPVVATVLSADFGSLMMRPPGCAVRFAPAPRLW
jgi:biotin-dependent carboxylase-like uncharacterized protein